MSGAGYTRPKSDLVEKMRARLEGAEPMSIADLIHEFDATERTVRRAVAELQDRGMIECEYDGRRKLWKLRPNTGLRNVGLTLGEATALRMALKSYAAFWETFSAAGFGEALASLMAKVDDVFFRAGKTATTVEKQIRPLMDAIIAEESIAATHVDVDQGALFKFDPYRIILREAVVKVEGAVSSRDGVDMLPVEGFTSIARLKGATFERPKRRSKGVVELAKRIGPKLEEMSEEKPEPDLRLVEA